MRPIAKASRGREPPVFCERSTGRPRLASDGTKRTLKPVTSRPNIRLVPYPAPDREAGFH
jgi:hypothetical protein